MKVFKQTIIILAILCMGFTARAQKDSALKIASLQFLPMMHRDTTVLKKDTSKIKVVILFMVNYPERMASFEYKIGSKTKSNDIISRKPKVNKKGKELFVEADSGTYTIKGGMVSYEIVMSKHKMKKVRYISVYATDTRGKKTEELVIDYAKLN